jgi:hypothetical protein
MVSSQLHAPASLPPRKESPVPIWQEVGWAPGPVWTTWRKVKILPLLGLELRPLCRSASSQSLYRLRYPGSKKTALFINTAVRTSKSNTISPVAYAIPGAYVSLHSSAEVHFWKYFKPETPLSCLQIFKEKCSSIASISSSGSSVCDRRFERTLFQSWWNRF